MTCIRDLLAEDLNGLNLTCSKEGMVVRTSLPYLDLRLYRKGWVKKSMTRDGDAWEKIWRGKKARIRVEGLSWTTTKIRGER
jgi:hypothetical protein